MDTRSEITKLEDGTINIHIFLPWALIEKTKSEVVSEHAKEAELPGFRKGMAPINLVEQNLSKEHLREDILKKLLPLSYGDAVKRNNLTPIINPRIHVEKLDDGKDWEYTAETCEAPKVNLNNYKDEVKKITAKSKIAVPGKEPQSASFEEIAKAIVDNVTIIIPKVILDQEVEKLLSQTLDEIKKLGLTLDQYLASTNKTTDTLRAEYAQKAERDVKLEFALLEIAKTENITVEEKEIEGAIATGKNDEEKANLSQNRYLLASIIRQQKTLDFLRNL